MSQRTYCQSPAAERARSLVESLQMRFVEALQRVSSAVHQAEPPFAAVEWLRDHGRHGGGVRYESGDTPIFNRASVNVSQVHYDDDPGKRLSSATALSTIIHPRHPRAPSVHMHMSWTEMRTGHGYWRIMADLNPSIVDEAAKARFAAALEQAAPSQYQHASAQGDRYFYIPALERHRGVTHFYLEQYRTDDAEADFQLTRAVGESAIDCYADLLKDALATAAEPDAEAVATQLAYHTLYFFQVLTLDRGTTSGLLIHDQNDVGILGSLPSHIDRELLRSWQSKVPSPQDALVAALADALPQMGKAGEPCPVTIESKRALAEVVRGHYRQFPEALSLQAAGDVIPPTVDNHR